MKTEPLDRWQCPYCQVVVDVIPAAVEVSHRCPNVRNKTVKWRKV